jgi:hypothetical protein
VIRVALKEWGENASDNPASLSRRLSILAASIRVAGRFPSFRVLPSPSPSLPRFRELSSNM